MSVATATIANISLYIPHVFANYTKEDVAKVFEDQNIGKVKTIDFVAKMSKEGKLYNAAYIHFEEWYNTVATRNFQSNVRDATKEARLMYEEPWYWVVLENKARKHIPGERKPCIVLDQPTTPTPAPVPVKEPQETEAQWKTVMKKINVPQKVAAAVNKRENLASHFDAVANSKQESPKPFVIEEINEFTDKIVSENVPQPMEQVGANEEELAWVDAIMEEEEAQLNEIEDAINEEEQHFVSIDSRYVQALEQEVEMYKQYCDLYFAELCKVTDLYKTESIKSQALAEAIQLIKK